MLRPLAPSWLVYAPGATQGPAHRIYDPESRCGDAPCRRMEYGDARQSHQQGALLARRLGCDVEIHEWVPLQGYRKVAIIYPHGGILALRAKTANA